MAHNNSHFDAFTEGERQEIDEGRGSKIGCVDICIQR